MNQAQEKFMMDRYASWNYYALDDFEILRAAGPTRWILCPLHGESCGYYAYFTFTHGEDYEVLNFPCTMKTGSTEWVQSWIDIRMGDNVKRVLQEEESKFRALMKKFEHIPLNSMEPEKAVVLWHSKGCPEEIAAEISTDYKEFYRLVNEHKQTGKNGNKKRKIYA